MFRETGNHTSNVMTPYERLNNDIFMPSSCLGVSYNGYILLMNNSFPPVSNKNMKSNFAFIHDAVTSSS